MHGWQERAEAKALFASKEVEEEIRKESVETVTPGAEVTSASDIVEEQQNPKVVAPTPEQILAIKV